MHLLMWLLFLYRVSQLKLLQDQHCAFIENLLSNLKSLVTNYLYFSYNTSINLLNLYENKIEVIAR